MASKKNAIEAILTLEMAAFRKGLNDATRQTKLFGKQLKESLGTFGGSQFSFVTNGFTAISAAASAAAIGGVYAFTTAMAAAITKASEFSTATFQMQSSITAANRQFDVGSAADWDKTIKELSASLRIFSDTELKNAAARTVDMTKRLGLTREEMKKVIQISGDLGAGKTDLVGAVERITAALRGEAEAAEFLGLTLNEDYVKGWYAANNATGKAWKDLTDLEKAQARYKVLLEQAGPALGKAAESTKIYAGGIKLLNTSFGDLQKEAGGLFTQNTFVIESLKIMSGVMDGLKANIAGNRDQMVSLVKDGILTFISGISSSIEVLRFFYNGWQGLSVIAHGAVTLIVKGMGMLYQSIRSVLIPFDLLLTGLTKIGVIDSNPLEDISKTLKGFGDFSAKGLDDLLNKISATNAQFDSAKKVVDDFKASIQNIPAEYQSTTEQLGAKTEKATKAMSQEVAKVGGVWTQVYKDAEKAQSSFFNQAMADLKKLQGEIGKVKIGSGTNSTEGYAKGGAIQPFFGGLPGYGGGDRRMILVEDGEHVIRKEAVARLGHGFFQRFNALSFPSLPKFATGGAIGGGSTGSTINLNISFAGNVSPISRQTAQANARLMLNEIEKLQRGRS